MDIATLSAEEMARLSPKEFRLMNRRGEWPELLSTQYCCRGYSQHTLVVLPKDWAFEFLLFCQRNPRPCYVSDVTDPGSPHPELLAPDADLRTDVSKYRVFKDGKVIDEPNDILKYWRDDLVSFLLPCSFSFEGVLRDYNVNFRHLGLYETNMRCRPAGRFPDVPVISTGRAFKTSHDAVRAIQITSRLPVAHGHPIHIGSPPPGFKNITQSAVWTSTPSDAPLEPGEVAMFWGCAYTPEAAIKAARPPLAIMHVINMLFISDRRVEEFAYNTDIGAILP